MAPPAAKASMTCWSVAMTVNVICGHLAGLLRIRIPIALVVTKDQKYQMNYWCGREETADIAA
jgi:hypothetical protein